MKNVLYIVGATVLVGGGAYLFLKNKKAKDLSKLADFQKESGAILGGTAPTANLTPQQVETIKNNIASGNTNVASGIVLSTPEQIAQVVNIANQQNQLNNEAQSIAKEINSLRTQLLTTLTSTTPSTSFGGLNLSSTQRGIISMKINQLNARLKTLGYKEVKGVAVKLV
jgi:predicted phage-related endonuclease